MTLFGYLMALLGCLMAGGPARAPDVRSNNFKEEARKFEHNSNSTFKYTIYLHWKLNLHFNLEIQIERQVQHTSQFNLVLYF